VTNFLCGHFAGIEQYLLFWELECNLEHIVIVLGWLEVNKEYGEG
jgi:hypothetical protein